MAMVRPMGRAFRIARKVIPSLDARYKLYSKLVNRKLKKKRTYISNQFDK